MAHNSTTHLRRLPAIVSSIEHNKLRLVYSRLCTSTEISGPYSQNDETSLILILQEVLKLLLEWLIIYAELLEGEYRIQL